MKDRRGCPVSTASDAAQDHVEQALWRLSSFYGDPLGDLDAASAADPGWMLPHVMRAGFLLSLTERHLLAPAREALDAATSCHGNDREQAHLAAAQRALAGDWQGACERIKNTPLPMNYQYFTKLFLYVFIFMLPFCLAGDFFRRADTDQFH